MGSNPTSLHKVGLSINIHTCTVYYPQVTLEMLYNYRKLTHEVDATIIPHWVYGEKWKKIRHQKWHDTDYIQIEWRNEAIKDVPNGEWMFIIDSDEILFGNLKLIPRLIDGLEERGYHVATMMYHKKLDEPAHFFSRLIKKGPGMEYIFRHDQIWWQGRNLLDPDYPKALIMCVRYMHLQPDYINWPFQIFEKEKTIGTYHKEDIVDVKYK